MARKPSEPIKPIEPAKARKPRKPARAAVTYTRELAQAILDRLAKGESLRSICRDQGMPDEAAVRLWALKDRDGFKAAYHEARNLALDAMADEVIAIADGENSTGDPIRDRLRFDARRWYLSKLAPKRYGDVMRYEVSGGIDLRAAIEAGQRRVDAHLRLRQGLTIDADETE